MLENIFSVLLNLSGLVLFVGLGVLISYAIMTVSRFGKGVSDIELYYWLFGGAIPGFILYIIIFM